MYVHERVPISVRALLEDAVLRTSGLIIMLLLFYIVLFYPDLYLNIGSCMKQVEPVTQWIL